MVDQGTVIRGTLRTEDLIPALLEELSVVSAARHDHMIPSYALEDEDSEWWQSEDAQWVLESLFGALNEHAPEGMYFGAHGGDGSDFGWWAFDVEDEGL